MNLNPCAHGRGKAVCPDCNRKHTPGPWRVDTWLVGERKEEVSFIVAEKDAVAKVERLWVPGQREGEAEANARIIAAAPELFEAVKRLQVRVFMHEGRSPEYMLASEAITKAEGGTA